MVSWYHIECEITRYAMPLDNLGNKSEHILSLSASLTSCLSFWKTNENTLSLAHIIHSFLLTLVAKLDQLIFLSRLPIPIW
jgi:hypothetical protein